MFIIITSIITINMLFCSFVLFLQVVERETKSMRKGKRGQWTAKLNSASEEHLSTLETVTRTVCDIKLHSVSFFMDD